MKLVAPIKNIEDINKIKEYLRTQNLRNYLIFVMGINTGIKTFQMLDLRFKDILDNENNIRNYIDINGIKYEITSNTKKAIKEYMESVSIDEDKNRYVFKSNKCDLSINRSHLYRILNDAAKKCEVNLSIGNETLRKTFGYHYYHKIGDLKHLQMILNQKSISRLCEYLDIDNQIDSNKKFNL